MARRQFGVSTRLYHAQRLGRDHLLEIASFGFETVELFAARTHFDYENEASVADLQQWLAQAGLELFSVLVPVEEDAARALFIARRIAVKVLVIQATTPRETARTVETLAESAAPLGVQIAVDSASMSPIGSLLHFVETADSRVGICLDFAHARKTGDLGDALETSGEHLVAVRVPLEGAIDWASALTTIRKIGYDGPLTIDADSRGSTKAALTRAKAGREQMERWLTSI